MSLTGTRPKESTRSGSCAEATASISEGLTLLMRESGSVVVAGAALDAEAGEVMSLIGLAGTGAVEATVVVGLGEGAGAAGEGLGVEGEDV